MIGDKENQDSNSAVSDITEVEGPKSFKGAITMAQLNSLSLAAITLNEKLSPSIRILESNEYYFISWSRKQKQQLTEENLSSLTKGLYQNIQRPTNKFLEDYEAFSNQFLNGGYDKMDTDADEEPEDFNFEEEKKGYDLHTFAEDFDDDDTKELDTIMGDVHEKSSEMESKLLEKAVIPLVEAFCHIQVGDINWAKRNIMWVKKYMALCKRRYPVFCQEYFLGVRYLSTLLKIEILLKERVSIPYLKRKLFSCRYEDLPDKGKAMVWVAKWTLLEGLDSRNTNLHIKNLKKIMSLDKLNWVWPYLLCMRMRCHRKLNAHYAKPCQKEIKAIADAVRLSSSHYYAGACFAGLCQTLSDILRFRTAIPSRNAFVEVIGDLTFASNDEIIDFILEGAKNALKRENVSFAELIRFGDIISINFLNVPENLLYAEHCYDSCLQLKPRNSKANHKMGLFKLVQLKDVPAAIKYLQQAVHFEPRNYPAWIDYIQTLLGIHTKHEKTLEEAFAAVNKIEIWKSEEQYAFSFLQGCHFFLKGHSDAAMEKWMTKISSDLVPTFSQFKMLKSIRERYLWDQSSDTSGLTLENIKLAIENRMLSKVLFERSELEMLKDDVEDAIKSNSRKGKTAKKQPSRSEMFNVEIPKLCTNRDHPSAADTDSCWRASGNSGNSAGTSKSSSENSHSKSGGRKRQCDSDSSWR